MPLKIGDKAPKFTSIDQNGDQISLTNFVGKKVVLFFYPKDNTPTCTVQACNLRDNYGALQKAGYAVLGISTDGVKSHQKFIKKFSLPFPLVVDEDKVINEKYDVWKEKSMFGNKYMGTVRTTFVIDEQGVLTDIISKVKSKEHSNQILK